MNKMTSSNTTQATRIIKKSDWKSWTVIAQPTFTSAQVRRDPLTGRAWSWVHGGKRVGIQEAR